MSDYLVPALSRSYRKTASERLEDYQLSQTVSGAYQARAAGRTALAAEDMAKSSKRTVVAIEGLSGSVGELKSEVSNVSAGLNSLDSSVRSLLEAAHSNTHALRGIKEGIDSVGSALKGSLDIQTELLKRDNFQASVEESVFLLSSSLRDLKSRLEAGIKPIPAYFAALEIMEETDNSGLSTPMIRGVANKERFADSVQDVKTLVADLESNDEVKAAKAWLDEEKRIAREKQSEFRSGVESELRIVKEEQNQVELELRSLSGFLQVNDGVIPSGVKALVIVGTILVGLVFSGITWFILGIIGAIVSTASDGLFTAILLLGTVLCVFVLPIVFPIVGWKLIKKRILLPKYIGQYLSQSGLNFNPNWLRMKKNEIDHSLSAGESKRASQVTRIKELKQSLKSSEG